MRNKKTVTTILAILREMYPDAVCSLSYDGVPFHLLVGAILSAQCTDRRVNEVTARLFPEYPDPLAMSSETEEVIGQKIKSCGLYHSKAHALVETSRMILSDYGGTIPNTREELQRFPGVGRKVANLFLGEVYGIPAVVVDTHCGRVAKRLGLTNSDSPLQAEKDLMACVPTEEWIKLGHRRVAHGRALCMARNPSCMNCPLKEVCVYARNGKRFDDRSESNPQLS